MKWFRRGVEQGHAIAQYNLGHMYDKGRGVSRDFGEAAKWFRLAAEQGDADAQDKLGFMYAKGFGVPQDYGEAVGGWTCRSTRTRESAAQTADRVRERVRCSSRPSPSGRSGFGLPTTRDWLCSHRRGRPETCAAGIESLGDNKKGRSFPSLRPMGRCRRISSVAACASQLATASRRRRRGSRSRRCDATAGAWRKDCSASEG